MAKSSSLFSLVFLVNVALTLSSVRRSSAQSPPLNGSIPALFTFGDSILDTGNNNNLRTFSKCNFPPYGRDFPGGVPTGRFCDGKVPSDLMAAALGIKELLPAYLDPNLKSNDLPTGVGFASGGSGSDPQTATVQGVLTLPNQLQLFNEYLVKLRALVGEDKAKTIIANSLFLISSGNNDVAFTYTTFRRPALVPFPAYAENLAGLSSNFINELYKLGARRFGVMSTLPLGCLPAARTIAGGPLRACDIVSNTNAQIFNGKLSSGIDALKTSLPDAKLVFIDVYSDLLQIIENPLQNGFLVVANGCCGTGTVEFGATCNQLNPFSCTNVGEYVFWDVGHPTEKTYRILVSHIIQKYRDAFF